MADDKEKPAKRTWEYDWIDARLNNLATIEDRLDDMGRDGWELVHVIPLLGGTAFHALLKRCSTDIPEKKDE